MKKKKKERGMGCNRNGKVAEMPVHLDWQILRISRSITHGNAFLTYISANRVIESIHLKCPKKKHRRKE
jgi:hypothetical protein